MEPQQTLSFDESVKQVMKSLPPVIRNYITGEKYTTVARGLMAKYKLRVDQGGVLEREILLLLMGVENPDEFTQALTEDAQLNKVVIASIVQDVNDQIFVPLRKEEEKGGTVTQEVRPSLHTAVASGGVVPMLKVEPQMQPVAPKVEPRIQPAMQKTVPQPVSNFNLENKIPVPRAAMPAPMPKKDWSNLPPAPMKGTLPPKEFLPRTSSLGDVVRSVLAAPAPVDASKLLEDHEEAHIEMKKAEVPAPVIPEVPIPEVQPSPILKVEPPVQKAAARPQVASENLPGVMMEPVIPVAPTVPKPAIPEVRSQMQFKPELAPEVRPSPILKVEPPIQMQKPIPVVPSVPSEPKPVSAPITSYPNDPYREPIDEVPGN